MTNTIQTDYLNNTIEITSQYDPTLVELLKSIPDHKWSSKKSAWVFPLTQYHAEQLVKMFGGKSDWVLDSRLYRYAQPKKVTEAIFYQRDGLYPFQSEAIDFAHSHGGRVILGEDMGLGKTLEALGYIRERSDTNKVLIVCPASVVYKWKAEIEKWITGSVVGVVLTGKQDLPDARFVVMSYSIMVAQQQVLRTMDWDVIVLDEAHKIKDKTSQRSRCAHSLSSKHVLLLTGTPVLNRPAELWSLLHLLNPVEWKDFWSYGVRYCNGYKSHFGWDFSGASNQEELRDRLTKYMIRRTKKEVLNQLPELTRTIVPVTVERGEIKAALSQLQEWIREHGYANGGRAEALVRLGKLRQAVGLAKVPSVIELAEDILEQSETQKLVVYAVHKSVVDALVKGLGKWGVSTITGDVSQEERSKRIDAFQNRPMPRVMVISSAGGEGINLYAADHVIFCEREWTPGAEEQAEARCHRIGQKNAVEALYPVAQKTMDEDMNQLIQAKRSVVKELVGLDDVRNITDELLNRISER